MLGVVADIGSTNARFALAEAGKDGAIILSDIATYPCADFPNIGDAARHYIDKLGSAPRRRQACLAVAAPVRGDRIALTNHRWVFSITELRQYLDLRHLFVMNDFAAVSLSLPQLAPADSVPIGPDVQTDRRDRYAVIGPGTGLGVGALVRTREQWFPVPSEGGHASFAPQGEEEQMVVRGLAARYGHVSRERLLSGPGLVAVAQALAGEGDLSRASLTAADVTRNALAGSDTICRRALEVFCSALGGVCGDLALTYLADRVFIAGGIAPRIVDFLRASGFRAAFEAKGRFSAHMTTVPTVVITHPYPGLLGAAMHLRQELERS
jgi:glucokinase